MGRQREIITALHTATPRDYLARMVDDKVACMEVARRFDEEFWDGERRYGYGGYRYDGRWKGVAEQLVATYGLTGESSILDVGCGKGFLLHELQLLVPGVRVCGFDCSGYAVDNAREEVRDRLFVHRAEEPYPFRDKEFDLVLSLTTLHNLHLPELSTALREVERVGRRSYIVVESYRSERELFNLQCWALTCAAFLAPRDWEWLFRESGFTGDYEFIFFA